ncbi:MAG: hypothetical protein ACYDCK_14225 [Thermoplasmatota archaeon]
MALLLFAGLAPFALATLSGSGQLNDIVAISTTTGTIATAALTTPDGTPVQSATLFTMTNSNSNVDTFIRYDWTSSPYYGASSSNTSIALHGTTYYISDLLYYKEVTVTGGGTTTTADALMPLTMKNSGTQNTVTWTSDGNACTAWTGSAALGFAKASSGSFTVKFYLGSTYASNDNTPTTSQTFYYCTDTTNSQTYLGTTQAFGSDTLVVAYTTDSALATLKTYVYTFVPTGATNGDSYCLTGFVGAGTAATPDLVMCNKLPYSLLGSATAKLDPLFDPPAFFPSGNTGGAASVVTFSITGTMWDPYSHTTTQSA